MGVGSRPGEDEDAPAEMAGPGTGRGNTDPLRIEPDFGQVCENGSKCPHSRFRIGVSHAPRARLHVAIGSLTEQLLHVLDDHQRRPQLAYGAGDEMPDAAAVALPQSRTTAGAGDVRAREPCRQHVDRLHGGPVHDLEVPEVGHAPEAAGEDRGLVRVVVRDPRQFAAEHVAYGSVEAAVT
jgi:hypothetical protein